VETGNCLTSFNGTTLGYDADGHLISKTRPGFTQTLTWNTRGQLTLLRLRRLRAPGAQDHGDEHHALSLGRG
jgi:YD repeat-containing protein